MNYIRIFHTITIIFFMLSLSTYAKATYFSSIERYSIDDGLPATTIFSLLKDNDGYFWLGTPKGLIRYDGYTFEVYSTGSHEGLNIATPDAGNIFKDSQNRIWVGSWGNGLALYDSQLSLIKYFKHVSTDPHSIGSDYIQTFYEDAKGQIWIGTNGGGLAVYNEANQHFRVYRHNENDESSLNHNRVWSIAETQEGDIWIATQNGLNQLINPEKGVFKHYRLDNANLHSISHSLTRSLLVDKNNQLWIGTETGFGRLDYKNAQFYEFNIAPNQPFEAAITKLVESPDGAIWVGTQKGLFRFDPEQERFTQLVNDMNYALLPHDDIRDIYFDDDQSMWVATRYAGLTRIDLSPSIFKPFNTFHSSNMGLMEVNHVYDLFQDKSGRIWVGSDTGLLELKDNELHQHPIENLNSLIQVFAISEDEKGRLWLGSSHGLGRLSEDRSHYEDKSHVLEKRTLGNTFTINDLLVDSGNNLWVATDFNGLYRYDGRQLRVFRHDPNIPDSISANRVTSLYEDGRARIWAGTYNAGVNRLDPGRTRFFRYQHTPNQAGSVSFGSINSVLQTSDGEMWMGTSSSLNRLIDVTDTFERFSNRDGLSNSSVQAMAEDSYGNLWLSTNSGLAQFKREQNFFITHDQSDIIKDNLFTANAVLKANDNALYFGGTGGILQVKASIKHGTTMQVKPQITGVWVDGKRAPKYDFNNETPLVLPHSVKNIRIRFSALTFNDNTQNQYSYRLVNFNDAWSPMESSNQVDFSGIDSGNYIFQIQSNTYPITNGLHPTSLRIVILTPWWQEPVLYVLLILASILIFFFSHRYRTRTLAKQKAALEKEISSRTSELLDAQKQLIEAEKGASLSGLVAGVAHEINTPIGISVTAASNLIERSNNIQTALSENRLKRSEFITQLNNIRDSAEIVLSNLHRASDLIGSFKEVSVDQISQQRRVFDLHHYMEEIIMSLTPKLKSEHISIQLDCPDDIVIDSYPGALAQMITNLAMNSIIHAFENRHSGNIKIQIKALNTQPQKIYLVFTDNGKGIAKDRIAKIFEPFYTTKRGQGGSGLGLQIISNIATIRLGGNIRCESELGVGTSFHIEFLAVAPKSSEG
ncbi:sensor histidine kinase [Alteromonas sp. a30]|uniref:sensor histidine kinase n=1 Tax=Alteromonas sp. a30 TaxID=2730917 RepID=UPI0022801E0A|nr:sensor histidine kinase [Alteromonas sp. a30]MCY7295150.1 hypothetical protein [Alteromonas sp. a30]